MNRDHGALAESRAEGLRAHLAARLRPLVVLLVAVVACSAPLAYFVLGVRELRAHGRAAAAHVAETMTQRARELPALWRYDRIKLVEHLEAYARLEPLAEIVVLDARGVRVDIGGDEAPMRDVVWEAAPIVVDGRRAGTAWVAMSIAGVQRGTAALALVFTALAALLGGLLYWLPLRMAGRAEQRMLAARSAAIRDAERRAVARELHDAAGQTLTGVRLGLQVLEAQADDPEAVRRGAAAAMALTDRAIDEVRHAVALLGPPIADGDGLVKALDRLADDFRDQHAIEVRRELRVAPESRAGTAVGQACYRIAQEALTNVARHAGAKRVELELRVEGDALRLTVADDGKGFDPSDRTDGLGLAGIRERAELLGGTMELSASPGRGTRLAVRLPVG